MFYPPIAGYCIVLFVMVGLTVIQRRGNLSRNSMIGIRTKYTLASEEAWKAAHDSAVPYLVVMAVAAGAHAVALSIVQMLFFSEPVGHVLALSGYVLVAATALVMWRFAERAARITADS
jgi:uncharacterized membrane protein